MAIYRLEADIIRRSRGRSSTASAAYRAAAKIEDERTGLVFDYTPRRGVLHSEILVPAGTPDWMRDRTQLWNAIEKVEKRKDAQLAREVLLSLPHELTPAQRIELVREYVTAEFVGQGMIADIAIHAPHRLADRRNHHAHVLLTMRELIGDGFGNKVRTWNEPEQLEQWRVRWAEVQNRHLERHGHAARVDHRSLADQGVDREPEPKQGPVATGMEREGRPSHAGDDRRAVQERNQERDALAGELAAVTAEIIELEGERRRREQEAMEEARRDEALKQEEERRRQEEERAARQREEQRQQAASRAIDKLARENADRLTQQLAEMEAQRARHAVYLAEQQRQAEEERKRQQSLNAARDAASAQEGAIRDANSRYAQALGQHYDIRDPYGSLARTAMAEYGAFHRDREKLAEQIAQAKDAQERQALELRREIEAADYMAITSRRIAAQSEVITGRKDGEEAVRNRALAAENEARAKELRAEFRELHAERAKRQAEEQVRAQSLVQETTRKGIERAKSAEVPSRAAAAEPSATGHEIALEKRKDEDERPAAKRDDPADKFGNVEMTDAKAAKLAKLRELREGVEKDHEARDETRSRDPGGGRRSR
jgi:hypothetical protein